MKKENKVLRETTIDECIKVHEVAAILGISRTKAYQLAHQRGFPCIKAGRRLLVPRNRFVQWMDVQIKMNK